jgi:hypothetical protein
MAIGGGRGRHLTVGLGQGAVEVAAHSLLQAAGSIEGWVLQPLGQRRVN